MTEVEIGAGVTVAVFGFGLLFSLALLSELGTESLTMPVTFSKTSPVLSLSVVWLPILTPPLDPDIPMVSARPAPPETMLSATRALF